MSDDDKRIAYMDSKKAFKTMYNEGYASGAKERRDQLSQTYFEEFYKIHYNLGSDLGLLKCLLDNHINNSTVGSGKKLETNACIQKFNELLQLLLNTQQQPEVSLNFNTDNDKLADQIGYFQIERNLENFTNKLDKKIFLDDIKLEQAKQLYRSILDEILLQSENENLCQQIQNAIKILR